MRLHRRAWGVRGPLQYPHMLAQHTIQTPSHTSGVGLHSGQRVALTLRPAAPHSGIVFHRTDLPQPVSIRARHDAVVDTRLASTLGAGAVRVHTVEHLLSACAGLGVDNLNVDLTAEELPILDGSAASFVYLLQSAGLQAQAAPRRFIQIEQPVHVAEGHGAQSKWARLEPYQGFALDFEIDFAHPAVHASGRQVSFDLGQGRYVRDIARARTFGFTRDVETMRANGLALGGGLDNAIVLDEVKVLNAEGLRYADEFAKHKVLDAIGDLYLAGLPVLGRYRAYRSGHGLNHRLLQALFAQPQAYRVVTFDHEQHAPQGFAALQPAW